METWVDVVANLGFPIAVAAFVLIRLEPVMREMRDSLILLAAHVNKNDSLNERDIVNIKDRIDGK